jgi:hypothetical protein
LDFHKNGYLIVLYQDSMDIIRYNGKWYKITPKPYEPERQTHEIAWDLLREPMVVPQDIYKKYVELFDLQGKEYSIRRAIVFLEDWKSGHYLELKGVPVTGWRAGFTPVWAYDAPHMAANIGATPRYTLQITGHV